MTFIVLNIIPFMRYLSSLFLFFLLVSCRSLEHSSTVVQNGSELFNVVRSADTVVVRDSVFVSERQKGDTVYLTRTEWRDRWRTRVERDTVVDVRVEKEVVQLPPERYVPKFYKWCTVLLFALLTVVFARWWLKRRI